MIASRLRTLTDEELVAEFENWARVHGHNVVDGEVRDTKLSYRQLNAIDEELRARGPTARLGLIRLLDHPELAVRYYAASWSLAVEPGRARTVIEAVRNLGPISLAGDAGMTLRMLDDGTFKPT